MKSSKNMPGSSTNNNIRPKAKQYQTLYSTYQVIKKCVNEIKAEQQMKLRQEQQLKAQQHAPKMKSHWHESINRASVCERTEKNLPFPFPDYKLPIHQSPAYQSIPNGCELSKFDS